MIQLLQEIPYIFWEMLANHAWLNLNIFTLYNCIRLH